MSELIPLSGCVITDEAAKVLLLHRKTVGRTWWELPGGKLEVGEEPEQAAVRELREELKVEVEIVKNLGSTSFTLDNKRYSYTWLQAQIIEGRPVVQEPDLHDDCRFFDLRRRGIAAEGLSPNVELLAWAIQNGEVQFDDF